MAIIVNFCVVLLAFICVANAQLNLLRGWSRQVPPAAILGNGLAECPTDAARQTARQQLQSTVRDSIQDYISNFAPAEMCGPGLWKKVFYFNGSNAINQSCPGNWTAQPAANTGCTGAESSCQSAFSGDISPAYNKVCGRVIGRGTDSPDGFIRFVDGQITIEDNYVDGVSVTYGASGSRMHIWTFGAGHSASIGGIARCPCDNPNRNDAPLPPPEVGDNYFCNRAHNFDEIWTGMDCSLDDPCCSFHNPPYFSVDLPSPTTDRVELRICSDQHAGDELLVVLFAEIYVQ